MATAKRMTKREKRRKDRDLNHMVEILNHKFSMRTIEPITRTQEILFDSYRRGYNIGAIGSAGTGKTMCALYLALKDVLEQDKYEKVIIVRSAVQTRDQGFMPGSLTEKMSYYEAPYIDITNHLFGRGDAYQILKQKNMIEFMSSSFIRGLTFDNAIIIVDEVQSCNYHEIKSVMTRVGKDSRVIICGDTKQDDLLTSKNKKDVSGLSDFLSIAREMDSFAIINFVVDDIVRSGFVKEFLIKEEEILGYA
jgi:phosphate starvation-inducible protein PhoH and related proteins